MKYKIDQHLFNLKLLCDQKRKGGDSDCERFAVAVLSWLTVIQRDLDKCHIIKECTCSEEEND
jgi:hypothetical protein